MKLLEVYKPQPDAKNLEKRLFNYNGSGFVKDREITERSMREPWDYWYLIAYYKVA